MRQTYLGCAAVTNIGEIYSSRKMVVVDVVIVMFRYEDASAAVDDPLTLPSVKVEPPSRKPSVTGAMTSDVLPQFVYDTRIDPKMRARMIENEMNEQAKLVQDLYQLRASRNTIEMEERKLHDLQVYLLLYMICTFISCDLSFNIFLQCFDAVGWVARRASSL